MEITGLHFDTGDTVQLDIADSKIRSIVSRQANQASDNLPWIAPGLCDIQMNGYGGQEFSSIDLTVEKVCQISRTMMSCGVTRYCPTLTTESPEVLKHGLRTIDAACESDPMVARLVAGIHLEGPYLSTEDGPRGAHPREHCRRPNWDEFARFQEAAGGRIRLHTMAAEFDEAPAYIRRLVAEGIVVAIGHTAAKTDQIRRAVDAGARLSTHLGNGCHPMIPRHHNYIWDQLAEDRLMASLIGDGHHLPPALLKTFLRAKTPQRCILVSDMSGQAGQPPGRYHSRFCDVEILPGGRLVVAGQREILAGAALPLGTGVANLLNYGGVSLATAIRLAVHHPARLLNLEIGVMEAGDPADLVLFRLIQRENLELQFQLRATIFAGELVWGSLEDADAD